VIRVSRFLLVFGVFAAAVLAQYRVDTRVGGGNPPVNRNLYSPSAMGGLANQSVRYAGAAQTSMPMRSEMRYEYRRVGALPSDIRMAQNAVGPAGPSSPMPYVAPKDYRERPNVSPPPKAAQSLTTTGTTARESIRYSGRSSPGANPYAVRPQSISKPVPPQQVSGALRASMVNGSATSGSVRYTK
jgi:hypothetical protein